MHIRHIGIKLVALCMVIVMASASVVGAQTSEEYLGQVRDRCEAIKSLLNAQRRHDLVARINRGRAYQNIIDQQQAFSLRLRNNQMTADAFDRQITTVQQAVERFRDSYNRYDDALGSLIGIDCRDKTLEFVEQLLVTRAARVLIGNEVTAIEFELTRYREITAAFQQELQQLNNSVLGEQQ